MTQSFPINTLPLITTLFKICVFSPITTSGPITTLFPIYTFLPNFAKGEITAFSDAFIDAKQVQWNAFCKKSRLLDVPADFREIVFAIKDFLNPIAASIRSDQ